GHYARQRDERSGVGDPAPGTSILPRHQRLRRDRKQHQQRVDHLARRDLGHGAFTTGSSIANAMPPPRRRHAVTRPPCASTVRLAMARPSPVPPGLSEKNGSKRCASAAGGTPGPVSLTCRIAAPSALATETASSRGPASSKASSALFT